MQGLLSAVLQILQQCLRSLVASVGNIGESSFPTSTVEGSALPMLAIDYPTSSFLKTKRTPIRLVHLHLPLRNVFVHPQGFPPEGKPSLHPSSTVSSLNLRIIHAQCIPPQLYRRPCSLLSYNSHVTMFSIRTYPLCTNDNRTRFWTLD